MMLGDQDQPVAKGTLGNRLAIAGAAATLSGCEITADSPDYISAGHQTLRSHDPGDQPGRHARFEATFG